MVQNEFYPPFSFIRVITFAERQSFTQETMNRIRFNLFSISACSKKKVGKVTLKMEAKLEMEMFGAWLGNIVHSNASRHGTTSSEDLS